MKDKRKECWSCQYFRAFYSKRLCHFENENCGFCRYNNKFINDKHHTCEKWFFNGSNRRFRKEVSLKVLNRELDHIVEIRQILVDEMKDDKIFPLEPK